MDGLSSVAVRSSSHETWSGVSAGSTPMRSAAAAVTCGAANEVPRPSWNSDGPQSEYGIPAHPVIDGVDQAAAGMVEKIGPPGATMSTYWRSRFE